MSLKQILRENLEKHLDNTTIGSEGYDITKDSKASALLNVLLEKDQHEEVGLLNIIPIKTYEGGLNMYRIHERRTSFFYYVGTEVEVTKFLMLGVNISRRGFENMLLGESGSYKVYRGN